MENSERLGRQVRPGLELGISCLPVSRAELICHFWGGAERGAGKATQRETDEVLNPVSFEICFLIL